MSNGAAAGAVSHDHLRRIVCLCPTAVARSREEASAGAVDPATILVVDDEPELCLALSKLLRRNGYRVLTAINGEEGLEMLRRHEVHLVLTDLMMPRLGGLDLLKAAQVVSPASEVVIITGHGTIETAVEAMKQGAYDFLEKPFTTATTLNVVRKALEKQQSDGREPRTAAATGGDPGAARHHRHERDDAGHGGDRAAGGLQSATVLLTGESGTGKEVVRERHPPLERPRRAAPRARSPAPRSRRPCSRRSSSATRREPSPAPSQRRKGRFEAAHRRHPLPGRGRRDASSIQVKLLRVLQEGTFERLGGNEPIDVDVRIIAATNPDLEKMVEGGASARISTTG